MSSSEIRYALHNGWEQKSKAFNFIPCKCTQKGHSHTAKAERKTKTCFDVCRFFFDLLRLRVHVCSFFCFEKKKQPLGLFTLSDTKEKESCKYSKLPIFNRSV